MRKAIVPGTFDPITNGHIDIIQRAAKIADEVVVGVAASKRKGPMFSLEERIALASGALEGIENVSVIGFSGLLVDFAHEIGAELVIKGLRATTDFEYEFQQAALNYHLDSSLEAVFVMAPPHHTYISSSIVREIALVGGSVDEFVPPCVRDALMAKMEGR